MGQQGMTISLIWLIIDATMQQCNPPAVARNGYVLCRKVIDVLRRFT
jgi:hypothetical protein